MSKIQTILQNPDLNILTQIQDKVIADQQKLIITLQTQLESMIRYTSSLETEVSELELKVIHLSPNKENEELI